MKPNENQSSNPAHRCFFFINHRQSHYSARSHHLFHELRLDDLHQTSESIMPLNEDLSHPSPAQVMELASQYADLLHALFYHPSYKYAQPPTAEFVKPSPDTPIGLYWTADFVQNTYVERVVPFLPAGATRKCKDIGNPWARADPAYAWTWAWDASTETLKDDRGEAVTFPTLSKAVLLDKLQDIYGRGMMTKKLVLENATDTKAQLLLGGAPYDFGEEVKRATEQIP